MKYNTEIIKTTTDMKVIINGIDEQTDARKFIRVDGRMVCDIQDREIRNVISRGRNATVAKAHLAINYKDNPFEDELFGKIITAARQICDFYGIQRYDMSEKIYAELPIWDSNITKARQDLRKGTDIIEIASEKIEVYAYRDSTGTAHLVVRFGSNSAYRVFHKENTAADTSFNSEDDVFPFAV